MGRSIKLTGAALEAAQQIYQASTHYDTMRKRLIEITEQEIKELQKDLDAVIKAQLPTIETAVMLNLSQPNSPELDLRYMNHGLAFVNVDDGDPRVEPAVSQTLS
jgi:hypothetical protein